MNSNFKSLSQDLESVIFSEAEINSMLDRLAKEITERYRESVLERKFVLVSVLKGSFIFIADLVRKLDLPCEVFFYIPPWKYYPS